jgi:hypothetical protein
MLIYQISLVKVQRATDANNSNFIGQQAGEAATKLIYQTSFGYGAGNYATNASYSNFICTVLVAINANNSNFFW